jgi:hypothetical protein
MVYDAYAQQANTPRSPVGSQVPSTFIQQTKSKLGVHHPPTVVVQPPSDSSIRSSGKRPPFERQESQNSTPLIINQVNGTPIFQAVPESTHSTADYPIANGSSITNFSTLRTQMSHAQHMQAWRQHQMKKIHKHRPYCYVYGPPPQRPIEEKLATAAILTPQIIPTKENVQRLARNSPFQYPRQDKTINEKTKKKHERQRSPIDIEENTQDKTIKKKSLRTTSALIHRKDSQSSVSNVTEV